MFKVLKELFGFPSYYSGKLQPHRPWPEEMMKSTGVAKPNNPAPPCPPVVESDIFKKAKAIVQLEGFEFYDNPYSFLGGNCSRYDLGDIRLITHTAYGEKKDYLEIYLQGGEIPLTQQESIELARIWNAKREKETKEINEERAARLKEEFLKLDLNELARNKTTD